MKLEAIIELVESAKYNLTNVDKIGTSILPLIDAQLEKAIEGLEKIENETN